MSRHACTALTWLLIVCVGFTGCHPTQPFYLHENCDLSTFIDQATEIEYPDVDLCTLPEAEFSAPPLNVTDPSFDKFWDLTFDEVVSIALHNSKVIRNVGAVTQFGFADGLLNRTANSVTIYDSALSETNTLGGPRPVDRSNGSLFLQEPQTQATQQGVEDALSEFDAQFFSSLSYGNTDRPRNVQTGNPFNPVFFQQHSSNYLAGLSKKTASGALYAFRNRTSYTENNIPIGIGRALPSEWQTEFEFEAQYPLLRGRGEQVNRIPIVLARINTDISLADFEISVRNLLKDLEDKYWDLYLAYRALETARAGRDAAQLTWKFVNDKFVAGQVNARDEAQAQGQFHDFEARLIDAQAQLFRTETNLRFLMGLAATDGRVIRPKDEPSLAEVMFSWEDVRTETLMRNAELRQQKWRIKQRELELIAARNQLLPRLNATALYRWVGVGDELTNADRNGINFPDVGSTAFDELTEGNFQEALFGVEFTPPQFGARRPLTAIRHAQLQLVRAQAQHEDMENQSIHLVTAAWQDTKSRYASAISHFNSWISTEREVRSAQAEFQGGRTTLDLVLDAHRRRAQAQINFYQALVEYNKAIADVHFRKGSLLDYDAVNLSEGPWADKAYWDATGVARERDASHPLNYGWTRPNVVSRGPVPQGGANGEMIPGMEEGSYLPNGEIVPAPQPTPAEPRENDKPMGEQDDEDQLPAPQKTPEGPITRRHSMPNALGNSRAEVSHPSARRMAATVTLDKAPEIKAKPIASPVTKDKVATSNVINDSAVVPASATVAERPTNGNPLRSGSASRGNSLR